MSKLEIILFFLYAFLSLGVMAWGMRYGSWQRLDSGQDTVIFRAPILRRVGTAMFILVFVPGLLPTNGSGGPNDMAGMCWGFVLLCLFLSGPNDLHLDLRRRTYRKVTGFPFIVTTGSIDSLGGAYVMTAGASQYWVLLRKAPGDGRGFLLGTFNNWGKAHDMAQQINTELQLHPT